MPIVFTGVDGTDYSFDDTTGIFELGSTGYNRADPNNPVAGVPGIATAMLDDGSTETLTSAATDLDPVLLIGVGNDGGDPIVRSDGTLTITADSTLVLEGTNKPEEGTNALVGDMGGTGHLEITDGGTFRIQDLNHENEVLLADSVTPEGNVIGFTNSEGMTVGRDGGVGTMTIDDGRLEIVGGFGFLGIGRRETSTGVGAAGGNGTVTLTNGAEILLHDISDSERFIGDETNPATQASRSGTQIGSGEGSIGLLDISGNSSLTIQSDHGGAFIEAGIDGGDGTLTLGTGAVVTMNAAKSFSSANFGVRGGQGAFNANASTLTIASGANFAGFQIGQDGGTGVANLTDSTVDVSTGDGFARIAVGFADDTVDGGTGDLIGTNSDFTATNADGGAELVVGDSGGDGEALFDAGSTVAITATEWTGMIVGRGDGALGTLTFDNASSLTIDGGSATDDDYGVYAQIGRDGGNGTVTFEDGSSLQMTSTASDSQAGIDVGWNDGTGRLELLAGAEATLTGVARANLNIGGKWDDFAGDAGTGDLEVNLAELSVKATAGEAQTQIGYGDGGDGGAIFDNAVFDMDTDGAANRTNMVVGWNGGLGAAEFRNGTQATLSSDLGTNLEVGGEWNDHDGAGGTGTVTMDGASTSFTMTAGGDDGVFIGIGRDGGTGTLNVTGGADLVATSSDTDAGTNLQIGATKAGGDAGNGTVTVTGTGSQLLLRQTDNQGSVHVGGNEGGSGLLEVLAGGRLELSDNAQSRGVLRIGAEDGGTAEVDVSGANSIITNLHYVTIGSRNDLNDPDNEAGRVGSLRVSDGGTFSANGANGFIGFGQGGTLRGGTGIGTLIGEVEFTGGADINMHDGMFGTLTFEDRTTTQGNSVINVRLDVGAAGNDRLILNDEWENNSGVAVILDMAGGFKFTRGQQKVLATFNGSVDGNGGSTVTVNGQQGDFSYYAGLTAAAPRNFVVLALNNGTAPGAANAGVLDYGAAGAGTLVYNALTQKGVVKGGKFGAVGGFAVKLDDIRGTNGIDNFSVTGTTARVLKFDGKGGNDIIKGGAGVDTILGGVGNDTLIGNRGNDILQGDTGKDTMTGNAGNDTFKFALKTHSAASHALADIITDFDDGGTGDKIDVSALAGPKLSYIGAAAFTKAGQVRVNDIAGADVIVEVNLSGSLATDFAIRLKATTLAQVGLDDFVL